MGLRKKLLARWGATLGMLILGAVGCDEAPIQQWPDSDRDGFTVIDGDCDDNDASRSPDAFEVCNGLDDDCDLLIDDDIRYSVSYRDVDADGYGDITATIRDCLIPDGYVEDMTDCDDEDPEVYPDALEECDGHDDDCNGKADDGLPYKTYHPDSDGDTFGASSASLDACSPPPGYVLDGTDCADAGAYINPDAEEICNNIDDDCDDKIDDQIPFKDYFQDLDDDGYGYNLTVLSSCKDVIGFVLQAGDCNDLRSDIYPGADETCDGMDNDCDEVVDGGLVFERYYRDGDNDSFGDPVVWVDSCSEMPGYVLNADDCLDKDPAIYPGADEAIGDSQDSDCNGSMDEIRTAVGLGGPGYNGEGKATEHTLNLPRGMAVGGDGSLYLADATNHRVRRITLSGMISTVAGDGTAGFSGDGGKAVEAQLDSPTDVSIDGKGNLYIADLFNNRIRGLDEHGLIRTVVGDGTPSCGGDGGTVSRAQLHYPRSVAVDASGMVYVANSECHRIQVIRPNDTVVTIAGTGDKGFSGDGGLATKAQLGRPFDLAFGGDGSLYFADPDFNRVRRVDPVGIITTVAGKGDSGYEGDGGPATLASLNQPEAIFLDDEGELFISDTGNNVIRMVERFGTILTLAGSGSLAPFETEGEALEVAIGRPAAVAISAGGDLLISDTRHSRIRSVDASGYLTTLAGAGSPSHSLGNGKAETASLYEPGAIVFGPEGALYLAEPQVGLVLKVDTSGNISRYAGSAAGADAGDGGPATLATLDGPHGLTVDSVGNLYLSTRTRVRMVTTRGLILTVAGGDEAGYSGDEGLAVDALLSSPAGLALDAEDGVLIADQGNNRVRRLDADGIITSLAGNGVSGLSGDGGQATRASLSAPGSVAVDGAGYVYIGDVGNQRVRMIAPDGVISTLAGGGTLIGSLGEDAAAIDCALASIQGLTAGAEGDLFLSEGFSTDPVHRVARVDPVGVLSTVAGTRYEGFGGEGGQSILATVYSPGGLALAPSGELYFADTLNHRVRKIRW